MQTVLLIDVDYFVRPKVTFHEAGTRPDDSGHQVRNLSEVEQFLRDRCLLKPDSLVRGVAAQDHDAAFGAIERWMAEDGLSVPFRLVHIDAHADLGLGDPGYAEIVEDVLLRDPKERADNLRYFGLGNWLAYAIANKWIGEVVFLREPDSAVDGELMACYFCDSPDYSVLQMRPMTRRHFLSIDHANRQKFSDLPTAEPAIAWTRVSESDFALSQSPDFIFTCLSPEYSPPKADCIYELVRKFIQQP